MSAKTIKSLTQYARAKRREGCPVCALIKSTREQLLAASKQKINRELQREWLRVEVGVKISDAQLTTHYSGKHDAED